MIYALLAALVLAVFAALRLLLCGVDVKPSHVAPRVRDPPLRTAGPAPVEQDLPDETKTPTLGVGPVVSCWEVRNGSW